MTITPDQLTKWRAICDAATEGPWTVKNWGSGCYSISSGNVDVTPGSFGKRENYDFIATARTAIPAWIEEVEQLREQNARLREALEWLRCQYAPAYDSDELREIDAVIENKRLVNAALGEGE